MSDESDFDKLREQNSILDVDYVRCCVCGKSFKMLGFTRICRECNKKIVNKI